MADLLLDPWPQQPYFHGAQSDGSTAYVLPAIAGAQACSFWFQSRFSYGSGSVSYLMDNRYRAAAEHYAHPTGGTTGYFVSGVNSPYNAEFVSMTAIWRKVYLAASLEGGFNLLSRCSNNEFYGPHNLAQLRLYNRPWTLAEIANPRGNGPADAVLAIYDLADVSGGILRDVSGNGYHGQVIGNLPTLF